MDICGRICYTVSKIRQEADDMEILFADKDLVVCVKPVGLDAESGVPAALEAQIGGTFFPIHRLDQNVGGVMV